MNNNRVKKIYNILKINPKGISGIDLAEQIGVTTRTLRNDIKKLQNLLEEKNIKIESNPKKGYILKNNDGNILEIYQVKNHNLSIKNEILRLLLLNYLYDKGTLLQEISEQFYISISKIKEILKELKRELHKFNIEIIPYANKGILFKGSSESIRELMFYVIKKDIFRIQDILPELDLKLFKNNILNSLLLDKNLYLAPNIKKNFYIYILISMMFSKFGKNIEYDGEIKKILTNSVEYKVIKNIIENNCSINNNLNESEIHYLVKILLANSNQKNKVINIELIIIERLLEEIKTILNIDFTQDSILKDGLLYHLNLALNRALYNYDKKNYFLNKIKQEYPLAFQMAVITNRSLKAYWNISLSDNEMGYLALHFGAALTRLNSISSFRSKRICLITSDGAGFSTLMKAKIEEYFKDKLEIIGIYKHYDIDNIDFINADAILVTKDIDDEIETKEISEKIIKIEHLLNIEDLKYIEKRIFSTQNVYRNMLKSLFTIESFYYKPGLSNKEECIEYLTQEAVKKGLITKTVKDSVFEREKMASTAIGGLVAIPHPVDNEYTKSFISILVLDKPIRWDDMLVQVVFLLNINMNDSKIWEKMILCIFDFIKYTEGVNSLITEKSYEKFIKEFERII